MIVVVVATATDLPGTLLTEATSAEPCRRDNAAASLSRSECLKTGRRTKRKMGNASREIDAEAAHVEATPRMTSLWASWLNS